MAGQRRSRRWSYTEAVGWIAVLAILAIAVVHQCVAVNAPKPVGECISQPVVPGGSAVETVMDAIETFGLNPNEVAGIHDAVMKSNARLVYAGGHLKVCLTPDRKEVASVNDVNAGG